MLIRSKILNSAAFATTAIVVASLSSAPAMAQNTTTTYPTTDTTQANKKDTAQKLVNEATDVVRKMKANPKLVKLMAKAQGIYIVPRFGRGALIVGGRGGAGLLLIKKNGAWSNPAFYDFGAISLGAQVGGSGGPIAFLLMNNHAVNAFHNQNHFSLNAGAGFTIVKFSNNAQASWGKGDIILWSHTAGAYVGATVSVTDLVWDGGNNQQYYGKTADLTNILNGKVTNPGADQLKSVLPG